jgi:hypothetical protein
LQSNIGSRVVLCRGGSLALARLTFVAFVICVPAVAQQSDATGNLPDPPSATAQSKPDQNKVDALGAVPVMNLLAGKSRVFPNLAVNTRPLTPQEKFYLACNNTVSPLTVIGTAMGAGFGQAFDTYPGYGQGAEGYFKRFGAGIAFSTSSNLMGSFALASILHEDPRYFVQNSGKFGQSVKYAVSRVFVSRRDNGSTGANWAGMLGPLGAAALSNVWVPADSRGAGHTFESWGIALAVNAGANVLREYWPHINKKLRLPNMGIDSSQSTLAPNLSPQATPPKPQLK